MKNDLTFAGKFPVVINKNGDTKDIFNPMNTTSCDISVVSNKILSDLYTDNKKGIKVKVEKIADITTTLFEGYMTPNTYSQRLSPNLDNIDMTAIDPIALMKYLYIDDILDKAKTITIGELIARAIAAVKIDCNTLLIDSSAVYEGENGDVKFEDMVVQTSNFWDEGGDACTVYDAVSECLRLFGYKLTFSRNQYIIYLGIAAHDYESVNREFYKYTVEDGGTLQFTTRSLINKMTYTYQYSAGDWTAIDDNTNMSVDDTYDRIESVASTKIPDFSNTAFDLISSEDRDLYDVGDLNVARNKVKGYNANKELITKDEWYYLWNGVYVSPDFGLEITGSTVNGYANINNAYEYLSGETGHPTATGGILNFYGGEDNPTGTSRDQDPERPVEVKECITVFAADNGIVPEFLERSDLAFTYTQLPGIDEDNQDASDFGTLTKNDEANAKYGVSKTGITEKVSYKQKYNINMAKEAEQTFVLDLSQSYSRTGINQNIDISTYSDVENKVFVLVDEWNGEEYIGQTAYLNRGTAYIYPRDWNSSNVVVDSNYFNRYSTGNSTGFVDADTYRIKQVWDKRKIVVSLKLPSGERYQFNGKQWVKTNIVDGNAFYLMKLMNNENIFNGEFTYDCIQCADGSIYSLAEDGVSFMLDDNNRVVTLDKNKKSTVKYDYYGATSNEWMKYIDSVGVGHISIILPAIDSINVLFECYVYNSNLLGMTGNTTRKTSRNSAHSVYFNVAGQVSTKNDYGVESLQTMTQYMTNDYGKVKAVNATLNNLPINATYVKAEHLKLDIALKVPETNLGQMFGESDIKYQTNHSKRFRGSFQAPDFQVNTKHQIVSQSHSYLMIGNSFANPEKFKIGNKSSKIACRPENYVLQGYKNYFGKLRRIYNRVLVPKKSWFGNDFCYIEVPDLPDTGNGRWLMVVSDSNDVKTGRHTITAVEDYGLNVEEIGNYAVIEIPRKSRNPLYDLPSVDKKK